MLREFVNYAKEKITSFPKTHKVIMWVVCLLLTFLIEEALKKHWDFLDQRVKIRFYLVNDGGLKVSLIIIFLVMFVSFVFLIVSYLRNSFQKKKIVDPSINEMVKKRIFFENVAQFANSKDAISSIQIYECNDLPNPKEPLDAKNVVLQFRRIGGYSKKNFRTNCILFDEFECAKDIYKKLYNVIICSRSLYQIIDGDGVGEYDHEEMCNTINNIHNLIEILTNKFKSINSEDEILEEHYFYYRVYLLLCKMAYIFQTAELQYLTEEKKLECSRTVCVKSNYILNEVGVPKNIEDKLKSGKRTGLLGAYLLNSLQLFSNEHSTTKSSRCYFASPVDDHRIVVFTYKYNLIGISPDQTEYNKCKSIFQEFVGVLGENI